MSTSARVQDLEYLYATNTNVSNIVSVKLSGSNNYHVWKSQMLCLLDSNNMGGIVDAKFVGPRYSGTDTVRQYESLARGWILGSVSEDLLADVHKLGSAKGVWEKLKSIYDLPTMSVQEGTPNLPDSTPTHSVAKMETEDRDANTIKEDANLNQIKVEQDIVPTETDPTNDAIAYYNNVNSYEPFPRMLRRFTENGNWSSIESILQKYKDKVSEIISSDGSQMLHIAVATGQNNFLKKLLLYLDDEQVLQTRYSDGSTALHISAIFGNKDAADLLLKKNSKLLRIKDRKGKEPLQKAYDNMHLDTVVYLLKAVIDDVTSQSSLPNSVHPGDKIVVELLVNAISTKQYDVALELMYTFPKSAATSDDVLMALAKSFPSGLNYVEKLVSPLTYGGLLNQYAGLLERWYLIKLVTGRFVYRLSNHAVFICRGEGKIAWGVMFRVLSAVSAMLLLAFLIIISPVLIVCSPIYMVYPHCWKSARLLAVPPIKNIENKKKKWDEATRLLEVTCHEIFKRGRGDLNHPYYTRPILEAARQNAYKVVDEILFRSPKAIQSTDKNGYDVIQLAIIHRSENVYNLIYDIGERKNLYRIILDSYKNNILHLVGRLAPSKVLSQRTGAALQVQRELQWREEVKKLVFPTYTTQENIFKETPDMVFTREHNDLVKEGEQWMKTTAESCSITAALIITIVFAAAITVPGGSNQEKGTPLFNKEIAFIIFAISDAISLFASSTALLVFLSILTTRFAEEDFLISLPRRLFIGLFSLILSTTTMIVAFSATLFLVFCDKKLWMLAPICGLAFIPIAIFVGLQFPLMVDLFRSTYLPIFGKQRKSELIEDMITEMESLS